MTPLQQKIFKLATFEINKIEGAEHLSENAFLTAWNDFSEILSKEYAIDMEKESDLFEKLFLEWLFS